LLCLRSVASDDAPPAVAPKKGPKLHFASGDSISSARRLAETRKFVVAPWNKDVTVRPIFAVSDGEGTVVKKWIPSAFQQFGSSSKLRMSLRRNVQTQEAVDEALETAAKIFSGPALVLYTIANQELESYLRAEAAKLDVPTVNLFGGLQTALLRRFDTKSASGDDWNDLLSDAEPTVFVASDGSGETAAAAARAALRRLEGAGARTITVCPEVTSLEEVLAIAREAFATQSVVTFSFASPGMSRFMRMQCERLKVPYADLLQPALIAMEQYLQYPFVGVPGGLDLDEAKGSSGNWKVEEV